jgi:ATP-dependent Zn protease
MKKLFMLGIFFLVSCEKDQNIEQISYSQFKQEVISDQIANVVYGSDQVTITGNRLDGSKFETIHPIYKKDNVVDSALKENGIPVIFEKKEQPSIFSQLVVWSFPIVLIFIYLSFPILAAYLASNRGQSEVLWFFLTLIFPFAILFIAMKNKIKKN